MFYLLDAALFLGFFALLLAFGLAVTSHHRSVVEALVWAPAAFLGVWGTLFYLAGLAGVFQAAPFWIGALAVLLGGCAWKRGDLAINARRLGASLRALTRVERALLTYVAGSALLLFALCLVPPSGADYDSLVYHLAVPMQWLRAGRVTELAYDHHSYFPFVGEMLYALALGVRGAVLAKLFHWAMLLFGALSLCVLGQRAGGKSAGLWAAALFISLPMTQTEATSAYIDLTFSAFAWAATALFCEALWGESDANARRKSWLLCGVFCGLCLGAKYFGWLVLGFLGVWLLVASTRELVGEEPKQRWTRLAWLGMPALALGGFWYVRNALWTGNPVFPFAFGVFGGRGWTRAMAVAYDADQAQFGYGKTALDLLLLPFRLAMAPLPVGVLNGQMKGLPFWPMDSSPLADPARSGLFDVRPVVFAVFPGPVLLATGVPALLARRKGALVGFVAWFLAFLWVFWALTSQQVRYLFPALGLMCALSGWMLAVRLPRFPLASRVAGVCLALWLLFSPLTTLHRAGGTFLVLTGAETPDAYLNRTCPGYTAEQWLGANTPAQSRFAVWGEPRGFYLPRPYFWADDPHNNLLDYGAITTPAQLTGALQALGATHVLVNRNPGRNGGVFGPPEPLFDQAVAAGKLRLLFAARDFEVYELR